MKIKPVWLGSVMLLALTMQVAEAATLFAGHVYVNDTFYDYLTSSPSAIAGGSLFQEQTISSLCPDWDCTITAIARVSGDKDYLIVEATNYGGVGSFLNAGLLGVSPNADGYQDYYLNNAPVITTIYFETIMTAVNSVPEPAMLALLSLGFLAMGKFLGHRRIAC